MCDPEARDARVHAIFGRQNALRAPGIKAAPFAHRGSPDDLPADHPHREALAEVYGSKHSIAKIVSRVGGDRYR